MFNNLKTKNKMRKILSFLLPVFLLLVGTNVWGATATMAYSGSTTTNMTSGNNAAYVGLSSTDWSVTATQTGATTPLYPGLNKAKDIRLYYNETASNVLTVSSSIDATINSITVTYIENYNNAIVKVGNLPVSDTNDEDLVGEYAINSTSFTMTVGSTAQVRISSIVIDYTPAYEITAISNNDSWGTVSGTTTITAVPAANYRVVAGLGGFTVTSGTASVTNNGNNTFSVTASSDCTVQINFEAIPSHTLSSAVTPSSAGTITFGATSVMEGSTTTATAAAAAGYKFTGWSITGTGASLSSTTANPTTITMGTANATVTATFEAVITHEINWSVNGSIVKTENVEEDEDLDFSAPASGIPTGYVFKGWVTAANIILTPTDSDPSANYVTSGTSTEDITYYAVMAKIISTTPASWTLTNLGDLTSSDVFVIACEKNSKHYAMPNNGTPPAPAEFSVENNKITTSVADGLKWNLTGNATNGYTFYPNGDNSSWLYCNTTASSGSNDNIRIGAGARKVWKPNNSGYLVTNDNNTARYLSMYNTQDFRSYVNTSNGAFVPKFYKYVSAVDVYGGYCTKTPYVGTLNNYSEASEGYATFCGSENFTISGATAYKAALNAEGDALELTSLSGIIPANAGIILAGTKGAEYTITYTAENATTITENILEGTTAEVTRTSIQTQENFYAFDKTDNTFKKYTGINFPANRAYFQTGATLAPSAIRIIDENNDATNIDAIEATDEAVKFILDGKLFIKKDGVVYDALGRVVR